MEDDPTAISRPARPVSPGRPRAARDYTRGNLHVNIWLLAWPMVADMLSSSVYQIVDVYWLGKLGSAALAAATLAAVIRWVLNSLAMGLGIGGLAVVARRIGEGDEAAANHTAWQVLVMAAGVSGVVGGAGFVLAEPILQPLGAEPEVVALGVPFLRISFAGLGAIGVLQSCNALLRGAGEARTAMWTMWVANGSAIVLASLLITGNLGFPALGVPGSALAMVLGRILPGIGPWIAGGVMSLVSARLSRNDEYEADAYAAALLSKAGIGIAPQISLFGKLDRLTHARAGAAPAWLLSHPKTKDRIAALRALDAKWHGTSQT